MPRSRRHGFRRIGSATAVALAVAILPTALMTPVASADELPAATTQSSNGSRIESVNTLDNRQVQLQVFSASMNRTIPVTVQRPADESVSRPVLYLLNGAGGGEDAASWQSQTDAEAFFSDKNAYIVTPQKGKWSYYTDWLQDDPKLGSNKWSTFLGEELPPLIDAQFDTNGRQSLAALSMTGTSVLNIAIKYPGKFSGVAAYSGCAQTSDPIGQQFVKLVVETYGGGNVENMWGPLDGPVWRENDPLLNAEKLRGTQIYMSTGSGLPGAPNDTFANPRLKNDPATLANQVIVGGGIEVATNFCTSNLAKRLDQLGIPATVDFRPIGNHSWGYWQDDLHKSWPFLAGSLGI
nr:alpha/beta hydrolase family protein [Rhodococcus sp. 06-418-5]